MTTQILDFDDEQIKELAEEIISKGYVVLHDQNLTQKQYAEVCNRIGDVETNNYFMNPKDNPEISLVSGLKDEAGNPIGVFGSSELQWHANGTGRHKFKEIVVSLYCVEECIDTVFSICSQVDCFAELSEADKKKYRTIDIELGWTEEAVYRPGVLIEESDISDQLGLQGELDIDGYKEDDDDRRPLVGKHPIDGREYLYFMASYIIGAFQHRERIALKPLYDELWKKLFRSKYMKHHVFRKGDLLFMDQLHTIHRRSPVKDTQRMLWRTALDYSNIQF